MPSGLNLRTAMTWKPRYFDIGVNFSDSMYQGYYNHSSTAKHPPDLDDVIARAHLFNVHNMLVTASTIKESQDHFDLCEKYKGQFYSTVGVHPCSVASEFYKKSGESHTHELADDYQQKLDVLKQLTIDGVEKGYVKAFGEIGLDYDRLHYATEDQQRTMFKQQLQVIASLSHLKLPLFLHMRAACDDFISIIKPFIDEGSIEAGNGVVHSFTGTEQELQKLLDLGFYIGINGCSLRTEENLGVAKLIPKNKLMIETDAPWCEVRKSHPSYKYVTPYPNKFYPLIPTSSIDPIDTKPQNKKKQQPIKLDDILPFPSIKKENYAKHFAAIQTLAEQGFSNDGSGIGQLAAPIIKSRNEPVFVGVVAQILCAIHGITEEKDIEDFLDTIYTNTSKMFG